MKSEAWDRFFERAILALVLAILVFAPLAFAAVHTQYFLVVQALAMGVLFLWVVRMVLTPEIKFFWPPICWAVLAFALYAIARYFTTDIEYVARMEMVQTLLYALLFFAIVNNLTSKESANAVALTLVFLAAAISCFAVWQYATHSNRVWNLISPYPGRASGTYISPNDFSCFLEMLLPLALAFFLTGRIRAITRVFLAYAALAMGAGLVVTFSRGGWVAATVGILGLLIVLLGHRKHRLAAFFLLVVMLAGGGIFVTKYLSHTFSYIQRVQGMEEKPPNDLEWRVPMWQAADKMWMDHFWFGVGPAHYDYRFGQYRPYVVQARPDRAHNDYVNLLADWGTVGGIIVACGMLFFAAGLPKTWKAVWPDEHDLSRGMSNRFAFYIGGTAALLALAVHSVMDFNLHIPANALLGVSLLALLTAQLRSATGNYRFGAGLPAKIVVMVVLVGAVMYFGFQGSRRWQEYRWLARDDSDLPLLTRAALLEKAFAVEPKNFDNAYNIGEFYRIQSFQGGQGYEALAQKAMEWYQRSMKLDPYDAYNYLGYGMCLDWLERHEDSETYYSQAEALDPNNYFIVANIGWHYVQAGDYPAARVCLERSIRLQWSDNVIGHSYWDIVQNKLAEDASGQAVLLPGY
jgi:O-antigen ligase